MNDENSIVRLHSVIGIVGCFQNGKSTLVNCLLDEKVATTGDGRATTRLPAVFSFGEFQEAFAHERKTEITTALPFQQYLNNSFDGGPCKYDEYRISLWKPLLQHVDIVDTPGFYANADDDETALRSLDDLDVVVLVVQNKGLSEVEQSVMQAIAERQLPFLVVMNCRETFGALWDPASQANARIARELVARLRNIGHAPIPIAGKFVYPINLAWFWHASGHLANEGGEAAKRLRAEIDYHFEDEPPEGRTFSHIASISKFPPLRRHLQLLATDLGMRRRPEGEAAQTLIGLSRRALQDGKSDLAMIHAERACYMAPGFHTALHNRASVCLIRNEYDETIHAATRGLDINARDVDTLFLRAAARFEKQDYHAAREDLLRIAELLQGDWHIAWEQEDKTSQASKYVEAYLMKIECDHREGKADDALAALRQIIDSDQKPMSDLDDAELQLIVWGLAAGLEYREGEYERSITAAGAAATFCANQVKASGRLMKLCEWFELTNCEFSVGSLEKFLNEEIQRILWKASLYVHGSVKSAVGAFIEHNRLPVLPTTWVDEPEFIPHFISRVGGGSDQFNDLADLVEQYFDVSGDENLHAFCELAEPGLRDRVLSDFRKATKSLCSVTTSTVLLGNSVTVTNLGNPVLSDLSVKVSYRLNERNVIKNLHMNSRTLKKGEQHHWQNVFQGKSTFGVNWFGGKKLGDVKVIKVNSQQGGVKVV